MDSTGTDGQEILFVGSGYRLLRQVPEVGPAMRTAIFPQAAEEEATAVQRSEGLALRCGKGFVSVLQERNHPADRASVVVEGTDLEGTCGDYGNDSTRFRRGRRLRGGCRRWCCRRVLSVLNT